MLVKKKKSLRERVWQRMYRDDAAAEQGQRCKYCFEPLSITQATADHIRPRARGGPTDRKNIAAACPDCNLAKGSMGEQVFKKRIKRPEATDPLGLWTAHFRRRLWRRTWRACQNIRQYAGLTDVHQS